MKLKIDASSLFSHHYLKLGKSNISYYEGTFLGSRSFRFDQIDAVLVSPTNVLSFQVGQEVFSIQMNPAKPRHQATLEALLENVKVWNARSSTINYAKPS